jgi:protein O-mannosyl-transferase
VRAGGHARILSPPRASSCPAARAPLPQSPTSAERAALPNRSPRWRAILGFALVAALALLAFLPALRQGFVLGDDEYNLVLNKRWRGLSIDELRWMWSTFYLGHWQPLTWMSFGLEHELWGVDPERMHAVNLAIHACSAVLAMILFERLLEAALRERADQHPQAVRLAAGFGALLWAVHPLRVESVVWATERRDLLSGMFLIAAVLTWLRRVSGGGRGWLAAALALYTLSLCSKAWGMTLPVLLLVLDVYPLRRVEAAGGGWRGLGRLALEKAPFLPLALGTAVVAAVAQAGTKAAIPLSEHGLIARCAQAAYGSLFYLWKTLAPAGLSTLYLLEERLDPARPIYLLSVVAVAALAAVLWALRKKLPALPAAACAYVVLVSPVLGFLQSGAQKVADRYSYLALIPLCALAAGGACLLLSERRRRAVSVAAGTLVIAAMIFSSWRQTLVWRDSLTLWERAAELEPENYVAQLNVAAVLRKEGRRDEARERAQLSIAANPGKVNTYARFYVGLLWLEEGDFEKALQAWKETLAVDPADVTTLTIAPRELAQRGRAAEGLALLEAGHAANPGEPELAGLLADFLWASGDRARAESVWRQALERDATWAAGHAGLGKALLARGDVASAERELRAALADEPRRGETLSLLGRTLRARGQVAEAEAAWSAVPQGDPAFAEAQALLQQSRAASAVGH